MGIVDGAPVNASYSNAAWVGQEFLKQGFASYATAGGTTTLTNTSPTFIYFTGTLNQTCVFPNATGISQSRIFKVSNQSTGVITIKANDGTTTLVTLQATQWVVMICTDVTTSNGTWISDLNSAISIPYVVPGTSGNVLTSNGSVWTSAAASGGNPNPNTTTLQYVTVKDTKTASTTGGTFTSGSFLTRTLNTLSNPASYSWITLASNQMTITSGTYWMRASAPAYAVDNHGARLMNITDSSATLFGTSEYSNSGGNYASSRSVITGIFTITSTKVFEIQHYCATTRISTGFGTGQFTGQIETYTEVEIFKLA